MSDTRAVFAGRVKTERQRRGWSMRELSRQADVSVTFVSRLESGRHEALLSSAERVADALGVPLTALLKAPACDICNDYPTPGFICGTCGAGGVS